LSLLDQVTIHELIHSFTLNDSIRAFLCNDELDAEDQPDQVYFSNATQQEVAMVANMEAQQVADNELQYLLTVIPNHEGWTYGCIADPTGGRSKIASVVRQRDKVSIPLDNVWQTDRTLRDGREPLYENMLHFVGLLPVDGETYLLTFEPAPDVELAVESYEGVAADIPMLTTPLQRLTVCFNKPVSEETFTTDDITLTCQGKHLQTNGITITKTDDTRYQLDISALTLADGYYVLAVQTAGITDTEGFNGRVGKQTAWIQFTGAGIETLTVPDTSGRKSRVYNLGGQRVQGLGRGILVVKGKKYFVK